MKAPSPEASNCPRVAWSAECRRPDVDGENHNSPSLAQMRSRLHPALKIRRKNSHAVRTGGGHGMIGLAFPSRGCLCRDRPKYLVS